MPSSEEAAAARAVTLLCSGQMNGSYEPLNVTSASAASASHEDIGDIEDIEDRTT